MPHQQLINEKFIVFIDLQLFLESWLLVEALKTYKPGSP